jgi:hypothetical protein
MLANSLKAGLQQTFPGAYRRLQETLTDYRLRRVTRLIEKQNGLVVQSGPFAGMTYVSEAICSSLVPKLLGSYEAELHPVLAEVFARNYETVIDIGCAEGYYAIGSAMRLPEARVLAFDINPRARDLCVRLAQANKVADRVQVEGECNHGRLRGLISERTLIICDCEGCELQLLDPALVPELRNCDLILELHDMIDPRITATTIARFDATHDITLIDAVDRDPGAFPLLREFSPLTQRAAVAEFRGEAMQWSYMRAKTSQA